MLIAQFGMYLTVMFIGFKLLGVIEWGWGTVVAPFPAALIISGIGALVIDRLEGGKK